MVATAEKRVVLRLNFEAEHSNVLIVIIELLKGTRVEVGITELKLELSSQRKLNNLENFQVSRFITPPNLAVDSSERIELFTR